jgi:hypothetical protein
MAKMTYIQALKVWNAKSTQQWCNPKKGSPQHAAVLRIMNGQSVVHDEVQKIEKKKPKKDKKSMKIDIK